MRLLGNPERSLGPTPKDLTIPHESRKIFQFRRGGVGPGKGAKDDKPTKPGKARLLGHVRMW